MKCLQSYCTFQAILPTFEVLAMSLQILLPIFFPNDSTIFIIIYTAVPLYFAPVENNKPNKKLTFLKVLNPLATILLVKPYRRAVLNAMLRRAHRVDSTNAAMNTTKNVSGNGATTNVAAITFTPVGPTDGRVNSAFFSN